MTDAAQQAFEAWIVAQRAVIDSTLDTIAREVPGEDPVSGAVRYAVSAGGKRLRPVLCLAALEAAGGAAATEPALRAACAIELVHTYSLVHDDLPCMDDDDMRRGRPTTHRAYGTPAAIFAGLALIPFASRVLAESAVRLGLSRSASTAAVRELCEGAGPAGMVGGQVLDLAAEHRQVGGAGLIAIHRMKTGALFRASLRIGGVLAAAPASQVDALGRFGERLGLAFQITDDVLDVTGDSAALGKTAGKDIGADKSTFAAELGVDGARRAAVTEVELALAELAGTGLRSPVLEGLARFAVSRDR